MKNLISVCILFFFSANQTFAQHAKIDVTIHSRVDTTQAEIKEVAELWINYLNSKPDHLSDNPYWNKAEKVKFKDFDFSVHYMYQFPSEQLLHYYKPTILSIEKEGEYYGIRTIFSAEGLEGVYRQSNPWCITKLYAVKDDGKWKLTNALPVITEKWERKTVGKITFIYPPQHKFNEDLAIKANQFCTEISEKFKFPDWEPFDFYITDNKDELGKLLNFDFYFAGITTGVGMRDNRMLLSGMGSEYYPHEFIHLIAPKQERAWIIEEGFATWNGGQDGGKTFEESAEIFANELAKNDTITFSHILNKKWGWQFAAFYTTGAILCNAAYEKGGVDLVNELLKIPNDNKKLIDNLCLIFDVKRKEFDIFWKSQTFKFKTR